MSYKVYCATFWLLKYCLNGAVDKVLLTPDQVVGIII